MYSVKCLWCNTGGPDKEVILDKKFFRHITALNYAVNYANTKCRTLNYDYSYSNKYFGIIIDKDYNGNVRAIKIQQYYTKPNDTTLYTEPVISVWVEKIKRKGR